MTRLVSAILARNEAGPDRYLKRVIERCQSFSDDVLLLDDASTDGTVALAESLGCKLFLSCVGGGFWKKGETPLRQLLWEQATELAGPDGWILVCDADQLLEGDVRPLCESWEAAAWAMPLVDCWDSEDQFRVDGPWGISPRNPRPWLFRPTMLREVARWPDSGTLHVGHAPLNWANAGPTFVAPSNIFWRHLGYVKKEHRLTKAAMYASVSDLSPFERSHALSIADE